jgi:hypothetical protein
MTWTTDPPTEPGWYPFKECDTAWLQFVHVTQNGRRFVWFVASADPRRLEDMPDVAQWGPRIESLDK